MPASVEEPLLETDPIRMCELLVGLPAVGVLGVVPGRDSAGPCAWFGDRGQAWRDRIEWATLDLSGHVEPCRWLADQPTSWLAGIEWVTLDLSAYRVVFDTMLPQAVQVADPFHVVRVANHALGRVPPPGAERDARPSRPPGRPALPCPAATRDGPRRLSEDGKDKLMGLLRAGDPRREVSWNAKEVVRQIYDHTDEQLADEWVDEIVRDFADHEMPLEVRRLGRTIARWRDQILAWHRSHVSNGPTEAVNNLVKRVKRVAFGLRTFKHYRIRACSTPAKPNWDLLPSITPP